MHEYGKDHVVLSAAYLRHRFDVLRRLRNFYATGAAAYLLGWSLRWVQAATGAQRHASGVGDFLMEMNCDRLIDETFHGERDGNVAGVNSTIAEMIKQERAGKMRLIPKPLSGKPPQQGELRGGQPLLVR